MYGHQAWETTDICLSLPCSLTRRFRFICARNCELRNRNPSTSKSCRLSARWCLVNGLMFKWSLCPLKRWEIGSFPYELRFLTNYRCIRFRNYRALSISSALITLIRYHIIIVVLLSQVIVGCVFFLYLLPSCAGGYCSPKLFTNSFSNWWIP